MTGEPEDGRWAIKGCLLLSEDYKLYIWLFILALSIISQAREARMEGSVISCGVLRLYLFKMPLPATGN